VEPPVFYAPPESFEGDDVSLPADESRHATRVMRLTLGAQVIVVDGLGSAWRGTISRLGVRKPVEVRLHAEVRNFGEPAVILTLAAGLSSGYKFDTVVEKGTELGVKRCDSYHCSRKSRWSGLMTLVGGAAAALGWKKSHWRLSSNVGDRTGLK